MAVDVYLEIGAKRVFAGAIEWPGWCRSGRDEESALEALAEAAPRYRAAVRGRGFPKDPSSFRVVERLQGNATTDFGAPAVPPSSDQLSIERGEAERLLRQLGACWTAFDASAERGEGIALRKGPRGGGRELDAIVAHVLEADRAYLSKLGGRAPKGSDMQDVRSAFADAFRARVRGEPIETRVKTPWPPRYAVRRSAWHAIDHAWEIEDRSET